MLNTSNDQRKLLPNFDQLFATTAQAPGGVARLRELILTLAVQGKLVAQDTGDEPASELLKKIRAEKDRLIAVGKIKRDKPLAAITEEEKPFELPQGWEWVRLGGVSKKITDGTHHSPPNFAKGDFMYLSAKNIKNWGIDLSSVTYVSKSVHEEIYARCDPEVGDVLYIKDGATTGILAINNISEEFSLLSSVGLVKPSCGVISGYMALVMRSPFFYQAMRDGMAGIAITRVTIAKLQVAKMPLPPLAEQSRIVARVEELMRLCDALEEKGRLEHTQHQQLLQALLDSLTQTQNAQELARHWQRLAQHFDLLIDRPEAVDALEQTILQLAVRGLLVEQDASDEPASELLKKIRAEKDRLIAEGKIKKDKPLPEISDDKKPFDLPLGWVWVRVSEICSTVTDGEHATPERCIDASQVRLVTAKNVRSECMDFAVTDYVPRNVAEQCWRRCKPEVGDVLMVSVGATTGRLCVLREDVDMVLVRSVTLLRSVQLGVDVSYFALHLMSTDSQKEIWTSVKQSAQPCLYLAKSAALKIALPPLAEQSRIVARVTELRTLCQQLRDKLTQARHTQTQLAQAWVEQAAA